MLLVVCVAIVAACGRGDAELPESTDGGLARSIESDGSFQRPHPSPSGPAAPEPAPVSPHGVEEPEVTVGAVAALDDAAGGSTGTVERGAQPAVFAYGDLRGAEAYARPGALVVAGRENYGDPRIRDISAAGGTVLLYLNTIIDNPAGRYHALLLSESSCGPAVPRWPGQPVANRWGHLNDFRVGGIEQAKIECVL